MGLFVLPEYLTKAGGAFAALLVVVLALLVGYDAGARYLFSAGSVALQELEWHLHATIFLLGLSYALKHDAHVRVDIFYEGYTYPNRALVRLVGMVVLVIPFALLIIVDAWEMTLQSYRQHEISSDPGGLSHRYVIKGMVVVGFGLLILQAIGEIAKALRVIRLTPTVGVWLGILAIGVLWSGLGIYYDWAYWIDPVYLMLLTSVLMLFLGFPVAFVFGGAALLFALLSVEVGLGVLEMLPYRLYGMMGNMTLMAVPLFILMGLILERSKMAERLLVAIARLFGRLRGGLAISVVLVGAILAASMGIVGASVVMMSLIALPLMIERGYAPSLASGSIAASGTLGQIIPPSVVLIILGDQMHLSVGDLFRAAVVPGLLLISLYLIYIILVAWLRPDIAPAVRQTAGDDTSWRQTLGAIIPPLLLIIAVLGSIFGGIASPTESAAVGVLGAFALAAFHGSLNYGIVRYAAIETVKLTAMIFMILVGATAFSLVFNELGGGDMALALFAPEQSSVGYFLLLSMVVIFVLGFFVDFIEIAFVVVPILVPIVYLLGIDPVWFAILIALNLQASFLTPPFGFALFYLKGAAGKRVATMAIYRGVVPFILLQLVALGVVILYPELIYLFG
jgi:tripartite ATP-independent transporter DctM subunit